MVTRILCASLALLALSIAACGDDDDDGSAEEEETTVTDDTSDGDDEDSGAPGEVTIQDFAFAPADLQVSVGDTITWTNLDTTSHTVTADDGTFDSGSISGDGTFEFTSDEAGEFAYHCEFHPGMTGTITVGEGASESGSDGGQPLSIGDGY